MSEQQFREIPKCNGLPHYKDKVKCLWCNENVRQRYEQLVSQEMAQGARVVKKDELKKVEKKHRQNTENVLKSLPHFDVS